MKLKIFFTAIIVVLVAAGSVNAKSFRINSNVNAKADYLSVVAAQADEKVVKAGDTLYLEPGHVEPGFTLTKKLHLIGPGYWNEGVLSNISYSSTAVINGQLHFAADGASITGCVISEINNYNNAHSITINRCLVLSVLHASNGTSYNIINCFIKGTVVIPPASSLVGSIIVGYRYELLYAGSGSSVSNNIFVGSTSIYDSHIIRATSLNQTTFTNNIVVNLTTHERYFADQDSTHYYRNNVISYDPSKGNTITNNVFGTEAKYKIEALQNNLYAGALLSDIFTLTGTEEDQYKLKEGSPAKGYGTSGTDCGAYGGLRPYVKGGYPQLIPVIYEVEIPNSPVDGKLPVKLKIRTQYD